jgi:hypothetical protein
MKSISKVFTGQTPKIIKCHFHQTLLQVKLYGFRFFSFFFRKLLSYYSKFRQVRRFSNSLLQGFYNSFFRLPKLTDLCHFGACHDDEGGFVLMDQRKYSGVKHLSTIILLVIGSLHSSVSVAQFLGSDYNYSSTTSPHVYTVGNQIITSNVGLNEINASAFRHFAKYYSFLPSANWVKTNDGFTVTSKDRNKIYYRIIFGRHGAMLYEMRYYSQLSVSKAVKVFLEHRFKDAIILGVPEITIGSKTYLALDIYVEGIEKIIQLSTFELKVIAQFGSAARPLETFLLLRGINIF